MAHWRLRLPGRVRRSHDESHANALAAEFVRGKIREIVADPATAELLCPRQPIGCKRMAVDSVGYYAAFNRPNVRLVDVSQHPIETVTPARVRDGRAGIRISIRSFSQPASTPLPAL